jgi:hypothetical protein
MQRQKGSCRTDKSCVCSIVTRPCKKRKDGAPSSTTGADQHRRKVGHPPSVLKVGEEVAPFAMAGAALLDLAIQAQCALDPSAPPEGIPIAPK